MPEFLAPVDDGLAVPPWLDSRVSWWRRLRSGMLRMAGREADGAIINWLSASMPP